MNIPFNSNVGLLIAGQQSASYALPPAPVPDVQTWQLAAGLEAAMILVLFLGWLHSTSRTRKRDLDEGESS